MGAQELLQNEVATPNEVVDRLDAVQPEDVARVASDLFNTEKLRLALVGPQGGVKTITKPPAVLTPDGS